MPASSQFTPHRHTMDTATVPAGLTELKGEVLQQIRGAGTGVTGGAVALDLDLGRAAASEAWGMTLHPEEKGLVVEEVLPGSPALRSGLKAHDVIARSAFFCQPATCEECATASAMPAPRQHFVSTCEECATASALCGTVSSAQACVITLLPLALVSHTARIYAPCSAPVLLTWSRSD